MSARQKDRKRHAGAGTDVMWRSNAEHKRFKAAQKRASLGFTVPNTTRTVPSLGDALLVALVTQSAPYANRMARAEDRGQRIETSQARQSAIAKPVKMRDLPGVVQPIVMRED